MIINDREVPIRIDMLSTYEEDPLSKGDNDEEVPPSLGRSDASTNMVYNSWLQVT